MSTVPQLVKDDPWLNPYADRIQKRKDRLEQAIRYIETGHGSLKAYANGHELIGVHQLDDGTWRVSEWLPKAKHVALVGDFNDWDGESHPLKPIPHGLCELLLPSETL